MKDVAVYNDTFICSEYLSLGVCSSLTSSLPEQPSKRVYDVMYASRKLAIFNLCDR